MACKSRAGSSPALPTNFMKGYIMNKEGNKGEDIGTIIFTALMVIVLLAVNIGVPVLVILALWKYVFG